MDFPDGAIVWSKTAELPVTNSTCVALDGRLLAIGGIEMGEKPACTTVLPDNQLMVVGGKCDLKGTKTNTVEFATTSINH